MKPGSSWRQHYAVRLLFSFFYSLFAECYHHRGRGVSLLWSAEPSISAALYKTHTCLVFPRATTTKGLVMVTLDASMLSILDMGPPL